jgi:hypothetical protein
VDSSNEEQAMLNRDERNANKILRRAGIGRLEKQGPNKYLVLGGGRTIIFGPLTWEGVLDLVDPMRKVEKELLPDAGNQSDRLSDGARDARQIAAEGRALMETVPEDEPEDEEVEELLNDIKEGREQAPLLLADFFLARDTVSFVYGGAAIFGLSERDKKALHATYEILARISSGYADSAYVSEDEFRAALRKGGTAVERGAKAAEAT